MIYYMPKILLMFNDCVEIILLYSIIKNNTILGVKKKTILL